MSTEYNKQLGRIEELIEQHRSGEASDDYVFSQILMEAAVMAEQIDMLNEHIDEVKKDKNIYEGGKKYLLGIIQRQNKDSDRAFLESIGPQNRTPVQQAYLDSINKENS